jgi:hypothetical protein
MKRVFDVMAECDAILSPLPDPQLPSLPSGEGRGPGDAPPQNADVAAVARRLAAELQRDRARIEAGADPRTARAIDGAGSFKS